ncbi:MAG: tetratricopeptide repeat protein [Sedimentisphaerales bacterium]|nr:tetratricopeptide repeat protein [Sedimentisphaerales bacterium]
MVERKQKDDQEIKQSEAQPERKSVKKSVKKKVRKKQTEPKAATTPKSHKELTEHEIFNGDEDFYKLLSESKISDAKKTAGIRQSLPGKNRLRHFTLLQKVIALGIILVTTILLYVLFGQKSGTINGPTSISAGQAPVDGRQESDLSKAAADSSNAAEVKMLKSSGNLPPSQPLSLKVARDFFQSKDYNKAYTVFNQLYEAMPVSEVMLRDFLRLQMALCLENAKDYENASRFFVLVTDSPSPIVRVLANYHLSMLEIRRKRYLHARTRAYKALALIKAVDFDHDWTMAFECDCYFLAAECLSRYVLSLSNADSDIPDSLWSKPNISMEPFTDLSEPQLRAVLSSGSEHIGTGLLDPKISRLEDRNVLPRWSVASYGAPIEELLAKFAADADIDIHWIFERESGLNPEPDVIRLSPATLYLPSLNSQQIVLIAAGCTGLLARSEEDSGRQKVTIYNPAEYSSLNEHVLFLGRHAISLWLKYILMFNNEERLGNAHFAMGLLQSQTDRSAEAIAEYKLVANRFSQTALAPFALLHSSKIKTELRDYQGAREDLRQLIEQYPDAEIYCRAYLRLADVTKMAGLNGEAAQLYSRVYNFGLSEDSKTESAFGAAGCFYQIEAYQDAAKWLTRYIDLAKGGRGNYLYSAYFLLGKTNLALGKYEQASEAFQYALTEQNSREQYVEAIKALVDGHIEQENFLEALDALENTREVALSEEQSVDMLLLKSKIYRMLGLVDAAIDSLRNRAEYVTDPKLNVKLTFELAQCYLANGDLELARGNFSAVLRSAEPGPLAQKTACELINVCLMLGKNSEAISVSLQLLDTNLPDDTRQETLKMLATAYNRQKDYDKAAMALSNQW